MLRSRATARHTARVAISRNDAYALRACGQPHLTFWINHTSFPTSMPRAWLKARVKDAEKFIALAVASKLDLG